MAHRNQMFFSQYFEFRTLITPNIIKTVYFLGAFFMTAIGISAFFSPDHLRGYPGVETGGVFMGFLLLVVGNLVWRVFCEGIILLFSLHEVAVSIDSKAKGL